MFKICIPFWNNKCFLTNWCLDSESVIIPQKSMPLIFLFNHGKSIERMVENKQTNKHTQVLLSNLHGDICKLNACLFSGKFC